MNAIPLRAVDRCQVVEADGGMTVVASVYVDPSDPNLRGHFPGFPIYPGVFVVETLRQAIDTALCPLGYRPRLREVRSLRLIAALQGEDELTLTATVTRSGDGWAVRATGARRDGQTAATITATFSEVPA